MSEYVRVSGPLLTGKPSDFVKKAISAGIKELTETGMKDLASGDTAVPVVTGNLRRQIAQTIETLSGRIESRAVYGAWIEGTGSRNETTRFKGYANFRREAEALNNKSKDTVQKHVDRLVKDLGG